MPPKYISSLMAFTISSASTNPRLFSRKNNISIMENIRENSENARVDFCYYQSACDDGVVGLSVHLACERLSVQISNATDLSHQNR